MSDKTKISWCDSTFNPWRGCDKVSPGCANCYITTSAPLRISGQKHGDPRVRASETYTQAPLKWNRTPFVDSNGVQRRRRVFCLSLGDIWDPCVSIPWLATTLEIIRRTPNLDWLLCSKRWQLWKSRVAAVESYCAESFMERGNLGGWCMGWLDGAIVPQNIWGIASVENQARYNEVVSDFLCVPLRIHALSCEPLLERLDIAQAHLISGIDWIIAGGESGHRARPCNIEWIRSIKDQCAAAKVPCFVKQMGSDARMPYLDPPRDENGGVKWKLKHPKGGDPSEWAEDLRVQQWPEVTL